MQLQELSDAWNRLRNAAQGRGVDPVVSSELADLITSEHERFRVWLLDQGPLDELAQQTVSNEPQRDWVRRYNQLRSMVDAEGKPTPPELEEPTTLAQDVVSTGSKLAAVVAVAAAALLLMKVRR